MYKKKALARGISKYWRLYIMLLPALIYFTIFCYLPITGIQIAFRDFSMKEGIYGGAWVGLKHFIRFFQSVQFGVLIKNTLSLSLGTLILTFPAPIILALLLNEAKSPKLKKAVQTLTYAPHFISTVVFVSMIILFLNPSSGIINRIIPLFGGTSKDFMGNEVWFRPVYIISDIWQNCGWSAIIYAAALAGVDQQLHEAAMIDGANRLQRIRHIDIPAIVPTMVILFIMNCGNVMSLGYEKVYLMQNSTNIAASEIISTYVYKVGLMQAQYSYTTAIGLFNSLINLCLLLAVNQIVKKLGNMSLF